MALTVTRLIGVYDADGSLLGELRYALRKVAGRGHCSLCDLTHHGVRRRPEWADVEARLGAPVTLLHRDERDDAVRAATRIATRDQLPAVLAEVDGELVTLLGPADLNACGTDVTEFEQRVRAAATAHDLQLA